MTLTKQIKFETPIFRIIKLPFHKSTALIFNEISECVKVKSKLLFWRKKVFFSGNIQDYFRTPLYKLWTEPKCESIYPSIHLQAALKGKMSGWHIIRPLVEHGGDIGYRGRGCVTKVDWGTPVGEVAWARIWIRKRKIVWSDDGQTNGQNFHL